MSWIIGRYNGNFHVQFNNTDVPWTQTWQTWLRFDSSFDGALLHCISNLFNSSTQRKWWMDIRKQRGINSLNHHLTFQIYSSIHSLRHAECIKQYIGKNIFSIFILKYDLPKNKHTEPWKLPLCVFLIEVLKNDLIYIVDYVSIYKVTLSLFRILLSAMNNEHHLWTPLR